MILYIMLVVLGFCLASLVFVLIAPSFWNRAVRLTRKRMESAMPLSLSEIEADKDQLRATFAVRIRRLESALSKAKEKSAHQLVEISRHQMAITGLKDQIAAMERVLDERRNAAAVFEMTIKKRFPELEDALAASQQALASRAYEVTDLQNKIKRREEALVLAQRATGLQQAEIARLRDAMEKSGAEKATRFKKRPSQWSLDEYRAEYDRLNVELSKLREQLSTAYDREANQISFLKAELQQLGEQIMASAVPAGGVSPGMTASRPADTQPVPAPALSPRPARLPPRRPAVDRRLSRPEPWQRAAEPVEAEPLDKLEIVRPGGPRPGRPAAAAMDDFANKSLEEVLEAALPMSGDVLIVREEMPAPPDGPRRSAALSSPVLLSEKPADENGTPGRSAPVSGTTGSPGGPPSNVTLEQTPARPASDPGGHETAAGRATLDAPGAGTTGKPALEPTPASPVAVPATSAMPNGTAKPPLSKDEPADPAPPPVTAPNRAEPAAASATAQSEAAVATASVESPGPTEPGLTAKSNSAGGSDETVPVTPPRQETPPRPDTATSAEPKKPDAAAQPAEVETPEPSQRGIRTLLERLRGVQERTPA